MSERLEPGDPFGEPPAPPMGVADAHGVVAVVCGLAVFGLSVVCCLDTVQDQYVIVGSTVIAAVGVWSGLFGVVTHGTPHGRGLAALGLAAIALSSAILCFGTAFGFIR